MRMDWTFVGNDSRICDLGVADFEAGEIIGVWLRRKFTGIDFNEFAQHRDKAAGVARE